MDIDKLRHFCVVVETGNLRRAAEILHISHSGLSKSIKALEDTLKVQLLVRDGRGITISEEGKRIYQKSPLLLDAYQELIRSGEDSKGKVVRIGTFEVFSTHFFGPMVRDYMPNILIELREFIPGQMEDMILQGVIEYGVTYEPIPKQGLEYTKVTDIEMGIFARKDYLNGRSLEEIEFAAPAAPIQNTPTGVKGLDGWPETKVERKIKYRVDMLETALELCRQGLAAVFAPTFVIGLHNEKFQSKMHLIEMITQKVKVRRTAYLVRRKSEPESKVYREIAKALRTFCKMKVS